MCSSSPLCIEEFDLSDKNFKPCPCGYQVRRSIFFLRLLPNLSPCAVFPFTTAMSTVV